MPCLEADLNLRKPFLTWSFLRDSLTQMFLFQYFLIYIYIFFHINHIKTIQPGCVRARVDCLGMESASKTKVTRRKTTQCSGFVKSFSTLSECFLISSSVYWFPQVPTLGATTKAQLRPGLVAKDGEIIWVRAISIQAAALAPARVKSQ